MTEHLKANGGLHEEEEMDIRSRHKQAILDGLNKSTHLPEIQVDVREELEDRFAPGTPS